MWPTSQVSPGISAAHEYQEGREGIDGTSLGAAPLPTQDFNQAANDPVDRDFEAEQDAPEHAPAPELDGPAPPLSTGPAQDSLTFNERQEAVDKASFYDRAHEDHTNENGQDGLENDNVNDGKENGGLDEGMDQD